MRKTKITNFVVLFVSILFCLIIMEILMRFLVQDPYLSDSKYGWRVDHPLKFSRYVDDEINKTRTVTIEYFDNGFKRWGDVNTNRKKVFIVGDSFTEMKFVNNGEEWYSHIENMFEIELFVYGAGGFGTYQEYLIIDEYIDRINPDVVIIQMHYNDFGDNDFKTDYNLYPMSNQAIRPYYENGAVKYRLPLKYSYLRKRLLILGYTFKLYDVYLRNQKMKNKDGFYNEIWGEIKRENFQDAKMYEGRFNEVLNNTISIFNLIKKRVGDKELLFFSVDSRPEWAEYYIANKTGINYISGLSNHIFYVHDNIRNTQVINDGHWNLYGNQLAGEYLIKYFKENEVLD